MELRRDMAGGPAVVVALDDSLAVRAAQEEIIRGLRGMLGRTLRAETKLPDESAIVLGTLKSIKQFLPKTTPLPSLTAEGYWLKTVAIGGQPRLLVVGGGPRGVLYGSFALLRMLALHERTERLDQTDEPYAPLRMVNQWDNLDGTIERGYAGASIFFESNNVAVNLGRGRDYARLLASVGINGCAINNVNANAHVIESSFLPEVARIAETFRPWGVRLFVSVDFSSPQKLGGLETFDPSDARVASWWRNQVEEIYRRIPDFGGFVLKADSEGRLGPSAYGRTHADAANVIARALKPHGGLIFYRGFVYDHHMDWRNLKNDRALAAYANFQPLDGKFDDNVIIQIKHGPIDFQVREPVSPLFGALEKTCQAIELQITQEYTGQQRHLCFLAPMWKEILDFDLQARGPGTPVKAIVAGKTFHRPTGGVVGVANVGRDTNWLGHHLAMANLYAFGRLAWNPELSSKQLAQEWTRLTFGLNPQVVKTITEMQLKSWSIYEHYTGPLGAGTLTDIINIHYGPAPESSEYNGWGQWHRADANGIGMDRTTATGTGFIGQYRPPVAARFESLSSCPDELLLFFHHVPYTYVLHSGKTVMQHIYDTHYEGAAEAEGLVREWKSIAGRMDEARYHEVLSRLEYQAGHAQVWRDALCSWFQRRSGIPDTKAKARGLPQRIEAENMKLEGYKVFGSQPWEAASGGKAVACSNPDGRGTMTTRYAGKPGWFDLRVQYFDQNNGVSRFRVFIAGQLVDEWLADDNLPTTQPDAHSSTRRVVRGVALRAGDEIQIEGTAQGGEQACVDYIEILPAEN